MIRHIGDDLFTLNKALFKRDEFMFIYQTPDRCPERCVGLGGARPRLILERICCRKDALKRLAFGVRTLRNLREARVWARLNFLRRYRYFRAHLSARQIFSKHYANYAPANYPCQNSGFTLFVFYFPNFSILLCSPHLVIFPASL